MQKIDFSRLPKDGRRFEALICELLRAMNFPILEEPAIGTDGGRDILIERVTRDHFGERRERVVVQCKHFAHTGRAVSEGDLGVWTNALQRYGAQGYLLVTSTTITENLNRVFIEFSKNNGPKYALAWSSEKLETLLNAHASVRDTFFPPEFSRRLRDLGQLGWGIIFPSTIDPAPIRSVLASLLQLRRRQVESIPGPGVYREFIGAEGVQPRESHIDWLSRHGVGPGTPNPSKVPQFLLIVGDPVSIPFEFQELLQVQYFVGRLFFNSSDEYGHYVDALCAAEAQASTALRQITFFAPENDSGTELTSKELVSVLASGLSQRRPDWVLNVFRGAEATKQKLAQILDREDDSSVIFCATHGASFRSGHPKQMQFQGALVTQDWPGLGGLVTDDHWLAACDVPGAAKLDGKIVFLFGCYGAGTVSIDEYWPGEREISPIPFVSALGMRLLFSGASAIIGHVSSAWRVSFRWRATGPQPQTFMSVLESLMNGEPVGVALQALSKRYAELATVFSSLQADTLRTGLTSLDSLEEVKVAMLDAKHYIVLGDPYAALG
jgi:hypothetical protein